MSDLSIHPVYLSARAAIVAPERAIPLTLYATHKWLPRLGPERWCLVMLLRSMSVDGKRRSDGTKRVSCSWRQLAELLDVHEETIASWLKHEPIPKDRPWRRIIPSDDKSESLALFIPRLRYAYETRNGKTRRTGFLLEILMEDPVVPEDEVKLQKQIELLRMQQGRLELETYRLNEEIATEENSDLPDLSKNLHKQESLGLHNINPARADSPNPANPLQMGLHNVSVNSDNPGLQKHVKQQNLGSDSYVNQENPSSPPPKPEESGKNVNELDILIQELKRNNLRKNLRREAFEPIIQLTEQLLNDTHSTGMLFKALDALYPERIDLYIAAVRVALDAARQDSTVNRGAVFVRALRDFSEIAGVDLGLKRKSNEYADENYPVGNLGSQYQPQVRPSLTPPSVLEAIWAETQAMLRRQMTQATYDAIIQGTTLLAQNEDRYIIGVQSEMAKEWLENRLHDIVVRALSSVVGKPIEIQFRLTEISG